MVESVCLESMKWVRESHGGVDYGVGRGRRLVEVSGTMHDNFTHTRRSITGVGVAIKK